MMKEFCNRDEKLPSISFSPEPRGLQPASGSSSHVKIPENLLPGVVQVKMKQLDNKRREEKSFILKDKHSSEHPCCLFTCWSSRWKFGFPVKPVPFFFQPSREVLPPPAK